MTASTCRNDMIWRWLGPTMILVCFLIIAYMLREYTHHFLLLTVFSMIFMLVFIPAILLPSRNIESIAAHNSAGTALQNGSMILVHRSAGSPVCKAEAETVMAQLQSLVAAEDSHASAEHDEFSSTNSESQGIGWSMPALITTTSSAASTASSTIIIPAQQPDNWRTPFRDTD